MSDRAFDPIASIKPNPLRWPAGVPRIERPERSKFFTTLSDARMNLANQLRRLGVREWAITSNGIVDRYGSLYADDRQPKTVDQGVALWFDLDGERRVFACDRWDRIGSNLHAIGKTLEAIRGIERWGVADADTRALEGFKALPEPARPRDWWEVLKLSPDADRDAIEIAYRVLAKRLHPDKGGDPAAFAELVDAWQDARNQRASEATTAGAIAAGR
jgi:hypothetical protein